MMGGNHAISGAAAWLAITATVPALPAWTGVEIPMTTGLFVQLPAVALLGAVLTGGSAVAADADHHSATIAHSIPVLGPLFAGAVETASGGHRKGTHTLWAVLGVAIISWMLQFLTWDTQTQFGVIGIGLGIAAVPLAAFAAKSIKAIWFVNSWVMAWLAGFLVGGILMFSLRGSFAWMPVAIVVGYAMHLVGDILTTGGIAPLYPLLPKPPEWWASKPVLNRIWQKNGYMSLPLLGNTGSIREWALGIVLTFYVLYCVLHETQHLVGLA